MHPLGTRSQKYHATHCCAAVVSVAAADVEAVAVVVEVVEAEVVEAVPASSAVVDTTDFF